jgi:hypothetical protein
LLVFKKLSLGCLGLVLLGVVLIVAVGVFASRSPSQTVAPAAAGVAAPAAASPKPAAPAPTPAGTPAQIGERVESAGIALTVNGVTRTDSLSQFQKAKPGRTYVVVDVTLETSREKTPYNPLYFKVRDGEGYEYTATVSTGDQSLKSGELNPGEKVRGTVAFDVPADAKGLVLSYQPLVILGGYQPIRVALD